MRVLIPGSHLHLPHFRFLTGDVNWRQYGGKWIGKRQNNGEFDYWLVIEFINWEEATGERNGHHRYWVGLSAVSPQEAGPVHLGQALAGWSQEGDSPEQEALLPDVVKVEALSDYGVSALLWQETGNNARKLLTQARQQALGAAHLFGFYMDGPQNRIGSTGWDLIRGDIDAGLRRQTAY